VSTSEHHVTAAEDRISLRQKSAYAVGMFVNNLQAAALPAMVVILNLGLGMNPVLVGWIGSIPRAFDAISDPVVGYLSDRTRTRWGRRRPYILAGALLAGLIFALMWQLPDGRSESFPLIPNRPSSSARRAGPRTPRATCTFRAAGPNENSNATTRS
jgi:GPH family glycoside/pentoside/hexuronide:cation symporter